MKVITTNLLNKFWKDGVLPIKNGKINVTDIVNNLTTTAANKVLDARQGKALADKYDQLNRNYTALNTRVAGFNSTRLYISSGKTGIYMRVPQTDWVKCVAFVVGSNNLDAVIQETVFAYYNPEVSQIKLKTKGDLTWTIDQLGMSVGSGNSISLYSEVLVFYYGFTKVDVF